MDFYIGGINLCAVAGVGDHCKGKKGKVKAKESK